MNRKFIFNFFVLNVLGEKIKQITYLTNVDLEFKFSNLALIHQSDEFHTGTEFKINFKILKLFLFN